MEVWWLVIGLFWGLTNLIPITEAADQEWTFGQVIAALMLVLPVISLIETLATRRFKANPQPSSITIDAEGSLRSPSKQKHFCGSSSSAYSHPTYTYAVYDAAGKVAIAQRRS